MKIVLKRRLMNELLTTYLPTILILIIVYITNYFKTFFFEAVVTVNLTALLVLTTLFISVSGSLPATAYVKMVDLWLIFAQMIPFFEVLLHTAMDMMRNDGEREINHHGTTIKPNNDEENNDDDANITKVLPIKNLDLISRNEETKVTALKIHYANLEKEKRSKRNLRRLALCMKFAHVYNPIAALSFIAIYWILGLRQAEFI